MVLMNRVQPDVTIEIARDQLAMMADLVKRAVNESLKALFEGNTLAARSIIEADKAINSYEIDIDTSTYGLLTIGNLPDDILRSIISIQKINAMLERIGDHAVNIAESAINLSLQASQTGRSAEFFDLPAMATSVKAVMADALASFFRRDVNLAAEVMAHDAAIDALNIAIGNEVKSGVLESDLPFEVAMEIVRVSKNLERIADLSTNIAEEATFAAMGVNVKHNRGPAEAIDENPMREEVA